MYFFPFAQYGIEKKPNEDDEDEDEDEDDEFGGGGGKKADEEQDPVLREYRTLNKSIHLGGSECGRGKALIG